MTPIDARQFRAGAWFVVVTFGIVMALNTGFLFARQPIGAWFPYVAPLLPAVVSLLIIRGMALPGGLEHWWALRPPTRRRLADGAVGGTLVVIAIPIVTAVVAHLAGWATLWRSEVLLQIVVTLPFAFVFSLISSFGEEAGWRGFLQRALEPWGFWRSALVIALCWAATKAPVYTVAALLGEMSWQRAVIWSLSVVPLGVLLSALVTRWGSIWPAVAAGAWPASSLALLGDAMWLSPAEDLMIALLSAALMLGVAAVLVRKPASEPVLQLS